MIPRWGMSLNIVRERGGGGEVIPRCGMSPTIVREGGGDTSVGDVLS